MIEIYVATSNGSRACSNHRSALGSVSGPNRWCRTSTTPQGQLVYGGFSHPALQTGEWMYLSLSLWESYTTWAARVNVTSLVVPS
eukprot:m.340578 g.340578  ORF g.340578 m.340578 type:complete len:85 (-) comp20595_c0_seq29:227-481(-)